MKKQSIMRYKFFTLVVLAAFSFYSCSDSENDILEQEQFTITDEIVLVDDKADLTDDDKAALLFMLEEEKLARDTYTFLGDYWNIQQFNNIKKSEQSHMDAIEYLLSYYEIAYDILSYGEFSDPELQSLYDQFIIDGKNDNITALTIGATIEDLDIVDLQLREDNTTSINIINVFEKLQCGSKNHLRAFTKGLAAYGENYTPQFLSTEAYEEIINSSSGGCN